MVVVGIDDSYIAQYSTVVATLLFINVWIILLVHLIYNIIKPICKLLEL